MNKSIRECVYKTLRDFEFISEDVPDSQRLRDDLQMNMFDIIEMAIDLEEECGCVILDEDLGKLTTIASVINYIEKYKR
jgi:acyl carrier protein